MRAAAALLTLSLSALPAFAQSVKLPAEVRGEAGAWIIVVPESKDGGEVRWKLGPGLTPVPIDRLFPGQKPAGVVVQAPKGRYEVWAWVAKGDAASDLAVCTVVVGDAPGPGPAPDPKPPEPKPEPAPIPRDGLHVLIVYESYDSLPAGQQLVLTAAAVREYLNEKCATEPDGKTKAWRLWDKDKVNPEAAAQVWRDAMKRPRTATPWIVVSNHPKGGYEGPLPATVDETLALLKKYAEK